MQSLTFTQKLFRQRNFFRSLIPLLALFVGLGAATTVSAQQSTATLRNVAVTYGTSTATTATGTFDAAPLSNSARTPSDRIFDGTDFGSLDTNSGMLLLQGGTIQIKETNGETYSQAFVDYGVAPGVFLGPDIPLTQTLQLTLTSFDAATNTRTFTLNGAARNVLALATTAGTPGTQYRFDIKVRAVGTSGVRGSAPLVLDGGARQSTFTAISSPPQTSTATLRNVVVTSGTTAANATTKTYDANATTPAPGVFNGTDFGILDANSSHLLLQGGAIQIAEKNGDTFDAAAIAFVVSPGDLNSANTPFGAGQTLPLTQTGYDAATMTRTFSLSNAARNILTLATTGGAGTSYRFDIAVSASGMDKGGNPISLLGARQRSVFTATGSPVITPTLTNTTILVTPNSGPTVSYDAANVSPNPDFNAADLGTFDIVSGQLVLNGGTATTNENGPNTISSVTLYYRVRMVGAGGGGFTPLALTQTNITTNADGSRTRTFALSTSAQNLLASVTATGGYSVDAYLQASGSNSTTGSNFTINNPDNNGTYTANFTVNGTPIITTVWTGGFNDNWFDPRNWTDGVPTATKNALIPNFASGTTAPYPNIYSDAVKAPTAAKQQLNPDGVTYTTIPADPGYSNIGSGNAMVRNLTLQANSQLDRSILRLIIGRLDVFGNFDNPQGSFIQRAAGIISFKSSGNQTISGSINGFVNVEIDGGINSIKTLTNSFAVKSGGYLKFINGILQTNTAMVSTNFISFEPTTTDPNTGVILPAAQLLGETEKSFFRGFLTTTQTATAGTRQPFSNIGITITFTGNEPGAVTVTRNNADNYPPTAFSASPPKPGIRRVFGVQPTNPNTNTGGLNGRLEFRYLSNELVNLRTNNGTPADFSGSVDQSKLSLYVSTTGGDTFTQLGRDSNSGNILVKNGVTTFATFTLSEQQGLLPLPVTLVTFDAKRTGADALVTWQTASELNNKGYNIQVSTNGKDFRTIGFVGSATPNSTRVTDYSFTDAEKNKVGVRYYRLEQLDIDGKVNYFAPRAVSFDGKATEGGATAFAYPNPFTSDVRLNIASVSEGKGSVRINDMTGRLVAQRQITLVNGVNEVELPNLGELKSGIYLVHVTLPTGEVKNLKVVKQ